MSQANPNTLLKGSSPLIVFILLRVRGFKGGGEIRAEAETQVTVSASICYPRDPTNSLRDAGREDVNGDRRVGWHSHFTNSREFRVVALPNESVPVELSWLLRGPFSVGKWLPYFLPYLGQ